jgi:hypothetical protein
MELFNYHYVILLQIMIPCFLLDEDVLRLLALLIVLEEMMIVYVNLIIFFHSYQYLLQNE